MVGLLSKLMAKRAALNNFFFCKVLFMRVVFNKSGVFIKKRDFAPVLSDFIKKERLMSIYGDLL